MRTWVEISVFLLSEHISIKVDSYRSLCLVRNVLNDSGVPDEYMESFKFGREYDLDISKNHMDLYEVIKLLVSSKCFICNFYS